MIGRKAAFVGGGVALLICSTPMIASAVRSAPAAPSAPVAQATAGDADGEPVSTPHPMVLNVGSANGRSVVVNDKGKTLYHFSEDKPGRSQCQANCTGTFLPVRSLGGKPQARSPLALPRVGSMMRPDGSYQVTFSALPLYEYKGDTKPGDAKADGLKAFGGTWTPATPGGKK